MSVCAHRPETPGFFTPCRECPCGQAVRAAEAATEAAGRAASGEADQNHTDDIRGRQIASRRPNDNGGIG